MAKMTKRDYFNILSDVVESTDRDDKAELLGFIEHELDLLNRKSTDRKPTPKQLENEDIKQDILTALQTCNRPTSVAELLVTSPRLSKLTPNKISALVLQLCESGDVVKKTEKRKNYYSLK